MIQSTFDIEFEEKQDDGTYKDSKMIVRLTEINPLDLSDMFSESINIVGTGKQSKVTYRPGAVVRNAVAYGVIVSPENILDRIANAKNGLGVVAKVSAEIQKFCQSPSDYEAKQTKSGTNESEGVENSVQ